jgi:hypothetical protein
MADEQLGLDLGETDMRDKPLFDPDEIREDALALLDQARAAGPDGPWDAAELKYRRIMFPHLVSWLPDEAEREQLCFAFAAEVARIELLLAA